MTHLTHPNPLAPPPPPQDPLTQDPLTRDLEELRQLAMQIARAEAALVLQRLARETAVQAHLAANPALAAATPAAPAAPPAAQRAVGFDRMALTIARLATVHATIRRHAQTPPRPTKPELARIAARRNRIRAKAARIIQAEAPPAHADTLERLVHERLDQHDMHHAIDHHPTHEVTLAICRGLGLPCDPARWPAALHHELTLSYPG